ncbi:MAG: cytochrome c biogenesis protein ResB, partial [Cyanobacteria bacterium J06631_9]
PAAYNTMDIGPAELQIVKATNKQSLTQALQAPKAQTQIAPWGTVEISWLGQSKQVDVKQSVEQNVDKAAGKVLTLRAQNKVLTVETTGFWPDFRLDGNRQPTSATQLLRNPAVQLLVSYRDTSKGGDEDAEPVQATESWFVFGKPGFEPIRTAIAGEPIESLVANYVIAPAKGPEAFFRVVVDGQGKLHYAANSSKGFKSGPLAVGDSVTPGWADFEVALTQYIPKAQVEREILPLPEGSPNQGEPALLVAAENEAGEQSEPVWVGWGEPTTVGSDRGDWYVAFSPKLLQLPFSLQLNDFIVDRNEGSESVAMWTSDVSLIDAHAGEVSGRRVWMNHPTWFKGWKIAQASWNPGDLNQSTLQVKREPWWVTGLTWLGSTMVTVGVATMFYGRSVAKKFKKVSNLLDAPESEEETTGSIPLLNALLGR